MKKVFLLMCVVCMLFICTLSVNAADEIKVMVDERNVEFDQPPVLMNDRTLVPVRAIFEKLGAKVDWNSETRTVTAKKDDITISLQIDNEEMNVNSDGQSKKVTLDQPPVILNNRTLVPVRAISEAFGAGVEWWPNTKTVAIDSDGVYEAKTPYFHDGKLYFNVSGHGTDKMRNEHVHQIYIWNGNDLVKIATPYTPEGYVVKGDYIFYYYWYDDYGTICRVKTDGTEHRVLYRAKDYYSPQKNLLIYNDRINFIENYFHPRDDEYKAAFRSIDYNGKQLKKVEVDEYFLIYDFWIEDNSALFAAVNSRSDTSDTFKVFKISFLDYSVEEVFTKNNYVHDSSNKFDRETCEFVKKDSDKTVGEAGGWRYYREGGDLYRENEEGDVEFVVQSYSKGRGAIFNDFIFNAVEDILYGAYTDTYTVEIMDLDGLNPQTIYFLDADSNFNTNNITDLSATGTPQDCGICGGAGRIECNVCDGSGKVRDYSYSVSSLRDEDGDARYRHCSFCNGGMKNCLGCGGDGRIHD